MCALGVHPRFAHMVFRAGDLGFPELGCLLASLLSERDLWRGGSSKGQAAKGGADLATRVAVLAGEGETGGLGFRLRDLGFAFRFRACDQLWTGASAGWRR